MSYEPNLNVLQKSIQISQTSIGSLSSDITTNTDLSFLSNKHVYFVDCKYIHTISSTSAGLLIWYNWNTAPKLGGVVKGNLPSQITLHNDDSFCAANTINQLMTTTTTSRGSATLVSRIAFKYLWRIQ
jgi:hypothetical protein